MAVIELLVSKNKATGLQNMEIALHFHKSLPCNLKRFLIFLKCFMQLLLL